jgi:hypothetical protein
MISSIRIIKSFWKNAFNLSSIQCNMPWDLSHEIIAWGKNHISDQDLAGKGREDDIHVTVLYGLQGHDPFELRELLANFGPIIIFLGETSIFMGDDFDVVKIDVISPRLHKLNKIISRKYEHVDTHPVYIPHITIAYVKPGLGVKYQGINEFSGREIKLETALFSGNDNRKTELSLNLKKSPC